MNALKAIVLATLVVPLLAVAGFAQETDVEGSKDHPLLTRMPGYYIDDYSESQFDSYTFKVKEGDKDKQQPVEGRRCNYQYRLQQSAVPASAALRNSPSRVARGRLVRSASSR